MKPAWFVPAAVILIAGCSSAVHPAEPATPTQPSFYRSPDSTGASRNEGGVPGFVAWVESRYSSTGYQASVGVKGQPNAVILLWRDPSQELETAISLEASNRHVTATLVPWPYNQDQYASLVRQLTREAAEISPEGASMSAILIQPTNQGRSVQLQVEFRGENLDTDALRLLESRLQKNVDPSVKLVAVNATSVPA